MEWYYVDKGQHAGPLTTEQLKAYVGNGQLPATTLVWRQGQAEWTPFSQTPELSAGMHLPPSGMPVAAPAVHAFTPPVAQGKISIGGALGEGWRIFAANPWQSMMLAAVFGSICLILQFIVSVLNIFSVMLLSPILMPVLFYAQGYFLVGFWKTAISLADRQNPPMGYLFPDGKYFGMPCVVSMIYYIVLFIGALVVYFASAIIGVLIIQIFAGTSHSPGTPPDESAMMLGGISMLIIVFGSLFLWSAFGALFKLYPALIAEYDYPSFPALIASIRYLWPSWLSYLFLWFLLHAMVFLGLMCVVVGAIPIGAYAMCVCGAMFRQLFPARYQQASAA